MNRPKFEEGEEVILVSHTHPQYNGEWVVVHALEFNQETKQAQHPDFPKPFTYQTLSTPFIYDIGVRTEGGYPLMCDEFELRKKHKPSKFSFGELMATLKTKIMEPVR